MSKPLPKIPVRAGQLFYGLGIGLGLLLALISLAGPWLNWPLVDESTYVLQARQIAEGLLPYRDFYDFVTPGSQLIGALLIRLNGFSLLSLRMFITIGWLIELLLLYTMGKNHLSKKGLGLLLTFLWLSDCQYIIFQHHFWSGLAALGATFMGWRYLQTFYNGKPQRRFMVLCGVLCAATFWITQSLGLLLAAALALYSLLHCFLHEREEKGVGYRQVNNGLVYTRWLKTWGLYGALPWLGFHLLCIGILMGLGIWPDFVRDTFQWLASGYYYKTTILGYYATFHQEFAKTIQPFLDGVQFPAILLFIFRLPLAFNLFVIGLLPIIGILGMGYALPNKFHYRLLQREDDELLLLLLCAIAMIVSTMSYATTMHILSNGSIAFLLGAIVISRFLRRRPRVKLLLFPVASFFCVLLLLGNTVNSLMSLTLDHWMTPTKTMQDALHYIDASTTSPQLVGLLNHLHQANEQHQSVFIFSQSPNLYLAGHYQNPTRFVLIIPQYTSQSQIAEIMQDLERKKPLYIVDDLVIHVIAKDARFSQYKPQDLTIPELQTFLNTHYTLEDHYGRYGVFRRKEN